MEQLLQVSLSEETIELINQWIKNSDSPAQKRNDLIDTAIKWYLSQKIQDNLKQQLEEGAKKRAKRDLNLAQEWFNLGSFTEHREK